MQYQVMALAAMCQAAHMVQKVAQGKSVNTYDLEMMLSSLVVTDPNSPEEIYRSQGDLKTGYQLVVQQLDSGPQKSVELVKYVGGLIQLERALNSKPQQLNLLGTKIEDIKRRLAHFEITDESVVAGLADIYADVVSPLGQRIQVFGEPSLLQQKQTQNKIRALLLVGIRAAVLWRQMGGKRRQFILSKGKLVRTAKSMI
ncbi:high frequency lysogenization protein HflD [Pseudoalteromonas sp. C2R02]|uniref:high frequency lysogenization protein HflD n=1 Tax=Pseudoalteromonas sp. C2R02 TaxID=2841565 RepID=UPI002091D03F|nr:high frequency lysogenization protein HflD [Pseudoalteromonas sp. C2R02]